MSTRLAALSRSYPRQFWLLFFGMLISTIGVSMIWPFLMIYLSERLNQPLTAVASLMTINAIVSLLASFVGGPVTDKAGRKWVMAISLGVNGLVYLMMVQANSLLQFGMLLSLSGAFNPLYRIAADAMMADLIPPERRADAYSLLRTSNNIGVALGPVIGGLLASRSYALAFLFAAIGMFIYSLLVALAATETLPKQEQTGEPFPQRELFGGYGKVLRDRQFLPFVGAFALNQVAAAIMWVLLGMYLKQNFGIQESRFSLIPLTNALMVVFFQFGVTQITKRYAPLWMLALGSLIYGLSVGSVALGQVYWAFWLSMVVMTVGELILSPTATTYAAGLAPADMRGRYMSLYGLTWNIAAGTGPVFAGVLSDNLGPAFMWVGGGMAGILSSLAFVLLARRNSAQALQPPVSSRF